MKPCAYPRIIFWLKKNRHTVFPCETQNVVFVLLFIIVSPFHQHIPCDIVVVFGYPLLIVGAYAEFLALTAQRAAKDYSLYRSRSQPGRLPYRVSVDSEGLDVDVEKRHTLACMLHLKVAFTVNISKDN